MLLEGEQIEPLCKKSMEEAARRWNAVAKPLYSFGQLEKKLIQIAGITKSAEICLDKRAILVFCADNGVVEEGVTQTGSQLTAAVAEHIRDGKSSANIIGKQAKADVFAIDAGMNRSVAGIRNQSVGAGTENIRKGPAMTLEQAEKGILAGMDTAKWAREQGYQVLCAGEMGIGNTTTAAAVTAAMLSLPAAEVVGRGAGLSQEGLYKKIKVVEEALERNQPNPFQPVETLAKVGGFDIAQLCGLFLGGAKYRIPVILDGFITGAAALLACKIAPLTAGYILGSHISKEKGMQSIVKALPVQPILHCDLGLGEGTGAALLLPLLDIASGFYKQGKTFDELALDAYQPFS